MLICITTTGRSFIVSDLTLNPNDPLSAMDRAGLFRSLGRGDEAVEWVRRAMRLNPYHPDWDWTALARLLHNAGCYVWIEQKTGLSLAGRQIAAIRLAMLGRGGRHVADMSAVLAFDGSRGG